MLGWFVDKCILNSAMKSDDLIDEDQVECRPEKVPCSVLDEAVEISIIRSFFTNDAWMVVTDVIQRNKEVDVWICALCEKDLADGTAAIICDSCLLWYHCTCVYVKQMPKKKMWFCKTCYSSHKK